MQTKPTPILNTIIRVGVEIRGGVGSKGMDEEIFGEGEVREEAGR